MTEPMTRREARLINRMNKKRRTYRVLAVLLSLIAVAAIALAALEYLGKLPGSGSDAPTAVASIDPSDMSSVDTSGADPSGTADNTGEVEPGSASDSASGNASGSASGSSDDASNADTDSSSGDTGADSASDASSASSAASSDQTYDPVWQTADPAKGTPTFKDIDGFRYLVYDDGTCVTGAFMTDEGERLIFTEDGKQYISCVGSAGGDYYYCDADGHITVNTCTELPDGSSVMSGADGKLYTGCVRIGDIVYTFTTRGLLRHTVDATKPMVALTYDDGPSSKNTVPILETLKQYKGYGTFFVCGRNIEQNKDIIQAIEDSGSEIGNHTFNHYMLSCLDLDQATGELSATSSYVEQITLNRPSIVRPPTGSLNELAYENARGVDKGYPLIMWSIDTIDWQHHDPEVSCQTIRDNVRDGSIILMHDMDNPSAVTATQMIVPELVAMGYQLVSVSEMAAARGGMEPGKAYYHFYPGE